MKWLGRLFIIGITITLLFGVMLYFNAKASEPPSLDNAPYAIQAYYIDKHGLKIPTRFYYTQNLEVVAGDAVMDVYWIYDGAKFHKVNDEKTITSPYDIIRRER